MADKEEKREKKEEKKRLKEEKKKEKQEKKGDKKKGKLFKLIVIVIFGCICGGAYFVFNVVLSTDGGASKAAYIRLEIKEEFAELIRNTMPELYQSLGSLGEEMLMIETEIERLKKIGDNYPDQQAQVLKETGKFSKILTKLETLLEKIKKNIESIYVSHKIDKVKGAEIIEVKKNELKSVVEASLESSASVTGRLREEKMDSLVNKIRAKVKTK